MDDFILLKADITRDEKETAKRLAKSRGMTFSGFLGRLVKEEISKARDAGEFDKQMNRV